MSYMLTNSLHHPLSLLSHLWVCISGDNLLSRKTFHLAFLSSTACKDPLDQHLKQKYIPCWGWCRTATSTLTMENVPWHADVKDFAEALAKERGGSEYELACEHAHSCCVLLARATKFKREGQWYTWIDYEKFHDLVSPQSWGYFFVQFGLYVTYWKG